MRCMGMCPGPSFMTWQSISQAILVSSPWVRSSANWASSFASAMEPGQAITEAERNVIGAHDLADLPEARVKEALLMMRKAPLGHDRASARDDARDAIGSHRYITQ